MNFVRSWFVIVLISFVALESNAQSRLNREMLQFDLKSQKLTTAVGWEINNQTGKWIENNKVISDAVCKSYSVSHKSQNFTWIQFATIKKGDRDFYVLLYEKLSGSYEYPSIYEGWQPEKRTFFFLITPEAYSMMRKKIEVGSGENVKLVSEISGYISDRYQILGAEHAYNEQILLAEITNSLEGFRSESCFLINAQTDNGKAVVRFRLPEACYGVEDKMRTAYFEVNAAGFHNVFVADSDEEEEIEDELEIEEIELDEYTGIEIIDDYEEDDDDVPFMIVENMPAMGDCKKMRGDERHQCTQMEIIRYVSKNMRYPPIAKDAGIQGTVFVYFVVGKDGKVRDIRVLREVDSDLDKEAARVVASLPDFESGTQRGVAVSVQYTIPVKFIIR